MTALASGIGMDQPQIYPQIYGRKPRNAAEWAAIGHDPTGRPIEYVQYLAESLEPATPAEIAQHQRTRITREERAEESVPWNVREARMMARDAQPIRPGAFIDVVSVWLESYPTIVGWLEDDEDGVDEEIEERVGMIAAYALAVQDEQRTRHLQRIYRLTGESLFYEISCAAEAYSLYIEIHDALCAYRRACRHSR